jgi:hypothetical protein
VGGGQAGNCGTIREQRGPCWGERFGFDTHRPIRSFSSLKIFNTPL